MKRSARAIAPGSVVSSKRMGLPDSRVLAQPSARGDKVSFLPAARTSRLASRAMMVGAYSVTVTAPPSGPKAGTWGMWRAAGVASRICCR